MTLHEEARAIREGAAITLLPSVWAVTARGDGAYDALDGIVPCDMFVRDGQVRHTLLLDEGGRPIADVYLGNDDGDYFLIGEGPSAGEAIEHLRRHTPAGVDVRYDDLSGTHALLSLNGPFAWEVMAALEGRGVVGLPYLSFFHPAPERTYIRAGKTGEFGYDLLVPRASVDALRAQILERGAAVGCRVASEEALRACALESWFFDVTRQRGEDATPVELQLQWRTSFKKSFVGADALRERRARRDLRRATAVRSAVEMARGDDVTFEGARVGVMLDAGPAPTIGGFVGLALLDAAYAHAGVDRYAVRGARARTFSPPAINNRSQFVNPQKHSYATRHEIAFPPAARTPWIDLQ
ncbi:MAG: aminomethyltransferase family protein [Labilithrix sp.]|nr:aminomethyltransferase family protein [Labilithrix sp.]